MPFLSNQLPHHWIVYPETTARSERFDVRGCYSRLCTRTRMKSGWLLVALVASIRMQRLFIGWSTVESSSQRNAGGVTRDRQPVQLPREAV